MPTRTDTLEGLTFIANEAVPYAIAWHVATLVAVVALLAGWRPLQRTAGFLLTLPLLSVGVIAWTYGNPFNAVVLLAITLVLALVASRLPEDRVRPGPPWTLLAGGLMLLYALVYPHFLAAPSPLLYLIAAPTGVVPCPTLALVIGFALLGGGFGYRPWAVTLAAAGFFYAVYGLLQLRVLLDLGLLAGAVALLGAAFHVTEPDEVDEVPGEPEPHAR